MEGSLGPAPNPGQVIRSQKIAVKGDQWVNADSQGEGLRVKASKSVSVGGCSR